MKAMVYTEYGSPEVFQLKEMEKPTAKDNELLIRVHATSVGYGDVMVRNFANIGTDQFNMPSILLPLARMGFGINRPKKQILGAEFSGHVEAIGKDVTEFDEGDAVFGYRGQNFGANAEYLCIPENAIVAHKPLNMSHEEAAALPYGAITAWNLLGKVGVSRGQNVLILGASGAIGSAAVQIAKHFGAEVTGLCSTPRLALVRALGADQAIDYTREDFTRNGETYDLIFDILGKSDFSTCKPLLKSRGCYLRASFKTKHLWQMLTTSMTGDKQVVCALSLEKQEDLVKIRELAEAGRIRTIIDKRFSLEELAGAHRYYESGQASGKVVITVHTQPDEGKESEQNA